MKVGDLVDTVININGQVWGCRGEVISCGDKFVVVKQSFDGVEWTIYDHEWVHTV